MANKSPLPPCPGTPNCFRTSKVFDVQSDEIFESLTQIFKQESHRFEVIDPERIEMHAVYRIRFFGYKDDVNIILEETKGKTTVFIRSASRVGNYDLGVNKRRVRRILRMLKSQIDN